MRNMEIQYPVGQGGLHFGIIGKSAYIYDCGCIGGKNVYEKYIDEIADLLEHVSEFYIFISHLHLDHCNGLNYLLKKIKSKLKPKIYIPAITDAEKIYLLLTSTIEEEAEYPSYYNLVVNNTLGDIREVATPLSEKDLEAWPKKIEKDSMSFFDWILYPFIKNGNSYKTLIDNDFINSYKKENSIDLNKPNIVIEYLKDYKNLVKLKTAYEKHVGKHKFHNTMLCLYSGLNFTRNHSRICSKHHLCKLFMLFPHGSDCYFTGWLHTGDINLEEEDTKNKFKEHFKDYLPNVMVMQIPHHGSPDYIDHDFCSILNHNPDVLYYLTCEANPDPKRTACPKRAIVVTPQIHESTERTFSIMRVEF
ncbi:hypothetical protein R83H12_00808 [Fibrobacteria bacterium R8-3-H12]